MGLAPPSFSAWLVARLDAMSRLHAAAGPLLLAAGLAVPLSAQGSNGVTVFTLDWQGPSQGRAGTGTGLLITEADLLSPVGGGPSFDALTPFQFLTGAELGLPLYSQCEPEPGERCAIEVDAFSSGSDRRLLSHAGFRWTLYFSTDEYAQGLSGVANVNVLALEAQGGDISADVFGRPFLAQVPLGPPMVPRPIANVGLLDGNGLPSSTGILYRGLGLVEPNLPGAGLPLNPFDTGDNIDGFDLDRPPGSMLVFFSLDAGFLDPLIGIQNSNSAQLNFGASGADVLMRNLGGGPVQVYAQAFQLGLHPLLDDVDGLVLAENGIPGFQPSLVPYDWESGSTDMLFFSVRRGSAVVGQIDSLLGIPIEPGDILTPPLAGPGLPAGTTPGIVVAAENLGLATMRSGAMVGDDLDGMDLGGEPPYHDCNGNNIEDAVDIATGASDDDNDNGIPDECEPPGSSSCECSLGLGPCGNDDAFAGCENSTGGGADLSGAGSSSLFTDDLVLTAGGLPTGQFGLFYMGSGLVQFPFGDGLRCIGGGPVFRFGIQNSGPGGTLTLGPNIVDYSCSGVFGSMGCILLASTWHFQGWYRDPTGPCGGFFNLTNAWSLIFTQ